MDRYKLEIKVYHKKDNANFVFWDRECRELIGNSALELKNLMIEVCTHKFTIKFFI